LVRGQTCFCPQYSIGEEKAKINIFFNAENAEFLSCLFFLGVLGVEKDFVIENTEVLALLLIGENRGEDFFEEIF
jgi:hypothetical protein